MKKEDRIKRIRDIREEAEGEPIICIREINQNIRNVFENKPLTRPLRVLNKNCEFQKRYELAFNLRNEERIEKERRERNQKPEYKAYQKAYYQRPEVKAYKKAYYQRPEVKAYKKAYNQKPEVKAYRKAYMKAYNQKPEVKAYRKAYMKAYYQKNKEKISEKNRIKYQLKKENGN